MGTTFALKQEQQSFVLVLAMAFVLSALIAKGELTFLNKLPYGLILDHPPGCCSPFTGFHPPPPGYGCAQCPLVYLFSNVSKTLDPIVGPYPLQFLRFVGHGMTHCVIGRNLTSTNTMTIGPQACGQDGRGIEATIVETGKPTPDFVVPFCMRLCIG